MRMCEVLQEPVRIDWTDPDAFREFLMFGPLLLQQNPALADFFTMMTNDLSQLSAAEHAAFSAKLAAPPHRDGRRKS